MLKLVLLRHGESEWNLQNRFTGWTDVKLSENGLKEAHRAGKWLKAIHFQPEVAFASALTRSNQTLNLVLEEMDLLYIPVYKSWRLNEKHYGQLQGLNKTETMKKFGEEQVHLWRRSYDVPPEPIPEDDPRNTKFDPRYKDLLDSEIPRTESLKDTINRMLPYWHIVISPTLKEKKNVIVVAHGNSLRGIAMYLKKMSTEEILNFNIATGIPYIFEFDDDMNLQKDFFLDPKDFEK